MIELQGGKPDVIDNYKLFEQPKRSKEILADKDGYIAGISCEKTGLISLKLGAGHETKESDIDFTAGIIFEVSAGDRLATLYTSTECDMEEIAEEFASVFTFNAEKTSTEKIVKKIIKGY